MSTQVLGYFSGSNHSTQSTANAGRPVPPSKPPRQAEVEARGQVAIDKLREFAAEKQALAAEKQALQQQNALLDKKLQVIEEKQTECRQKIEAAHQQKVALEAREQQVDARIAARQENLAKTQENLAKTQARRAELAEEMKETDTQRAAALARQQESQDKRVQYLGNLKNMLRIVNQQICIVNGLGSTNPNKENLLNELNQLNQRGAAIQAVILNGKFAEFLPQLKSLQTDLKEIREKVTIAKA
jgi:chromosome segregation ATPase